MSLTLAEKKEFAQLYWLTQVYGQVSRYDLQRLALLENKLTDTQADRLEYLMETKYDEDKYKPSEKAILRALRGQS